MSSVRGCFFAPVSYRSGAAFCFGGFHDTRPCAGSSPSSRRATSLISAVPIRRSDLALIREAFEASKVVIEAQPGDVLMLDNSLAAHCVVRHGGRPLEFAREYPSEVSLALADPMWCDDAPPNGAHPADHQ